MKARNGVVVVVLVVGTIVAVAVPASARLRLSAGTPSANAPVIGTGTPGNAGTVLNDSLNAVSCTNPPSKFIPPSFCMAVGYGDEGASAERWNGRSWSIVPTPSIVKNVALSGVSCTSPLYCIAVGSYLFHRHQ